jgi:hypothetical protein
MLFNIKIANIVFENALPNYFFKELVIVYLKDKTVLTSQDNFKANKEKNELIVNVK